MIWIFHFLTINILLFISKKIFNRDFFIKATFIYTIFIFGQRWMTGEDFPNYLLYYLIDFKGPEWGYYTLQSFFSNFNLYFGLFTCLLFSINVYNNYKFINKLNKNVVLTLYLYMFSELFFASMSQITQFIAISFFINSYFYSYNKEYFKSALNIVLAATFHQSALFLIPFLFLRFTLTRKKIFGFFLVALILPFINVTPILTLDIFNLYNFYLGSSYDVGLGISHYLRYFIILLLFLFYIYNLKKFTIKSLDSMIMHGIIFYILLYGLSFQVGLLLRISHFFKIFEVVFIAYYYDEIKFFSKKVIKTTLITFFLSIYVFLGVMDPYSISRYQFRSLRTHDERSKIELLNEINNF